MKQQLKSYSWFLFPLSLPPSQRYSVLLMVSLSLAFCWWSWIYNPLRKQRASLMTQLCAPQQEDVVVGNRLNRLQQSLHQLSCKELTTIASLSRVTFEEIKFLSHSTMHLSFFGTYDAVMHCMQELYERCPLMQVERMSMECRDQVLRFVNLEISNLQLTGDSNDA
jgi:hypothetical protein